MLHQVSVTETLRHILSVTLHTCRMTNLTIFSVYIVLSIVNWAFSLLNHYAIARFILSSCFGGGLLRGPLQC